MIRGIDAVIEILKLEGVKFVSCFPGGKASDGLIDASAQAQIRTILTRHERVAVNIADGYTRVSGRTGVVIVTGGVGSENAFAGVSQSFSDLVPILVLTGQQTRRRLGIRTPQDFDTLHNYSKITKWVGRINFADRVPEMMRRAFTYLKTGRPGPVLLEIPSDVSYEDFDDVMFNYKPVTGWKTAGNPRDVELAIRALFKARNPLIYAGEGVIHAGASKELREFAELVETPVMTTLKAKSVFPEDHPLSVGCGGRVGGEPASYFLRKADLVFSIGASLKKGFGAIINKGKLILQSTIDELDINNDYMADFVIMGDAKLVLKQLIGSFKKQLGLGRRVNNEALRKEIKSVKKKWLSEWMPNLSSDEVPINPYRVVWDLNRTVDKQKTIITHDAGLPRDHLAPFFEAVIPRGYIGWGHHSTLGYSLGGAMGAKLAQPNKTVINVIGDGGFGMVGMDFETAVRERIPILTVILNNSCLGAYVKRTPTASTLSGNYAKLAEALGGYSERVEEPDEIIPAIKRAIQWTDSGRPALLEIITKVESAIQET